MTGTAARYSGSPYLLFQPEITLPEFYNFILVGDLNGIILRGQAAATGAVVSNPEQQMQDLFV